jgi:hypothetical protein
VLQKTGDLDDFISNLIDLIIEFVISIRTVVGHFRNASEFRRVFWAAQHCAIERRGGFCVIVVTSL